MTAGDEKKPLDLMFSDPCRYFASGSVTERRLAAAADVLANSGLVRETVADWVVVELAAEVLRVDASNTMLPTRCCQREFRPGPDPTEVVKVTPADQHMAAIRLALRFRFQSKPPRKPA